MIACVLPTMPLFSGPWALRKNYTATPFPGLGYVARGELGPLRLSCLRRLESHVHGRFGRYPIVEFVARCKSAPLSTEIRFRRH
jgi:hypothetical protein